MTRRAVTARVLGVILCVLALASCTSSGTPGNGSGVPTTTTPGSDTSTLTDTPTDTSTTTAGTTSPPASPTTTATHTGDECTFAQLSMHAISGSGAAQREFASVVFTNTSTKTCSMYGYPGISLRANGVLLGQPASRDASSPPKTVHLAPGAQAHADITDFSSCQAPLSEVVRVYPPDSTQFLDLPLQLRGCTLSVQPVVAP